MRLSFIIIISLIMIMNLHPIHGNFCSRFLDSNVTGEILLNLDSTQLKQLGVVSKNDREKIKEKIKELRKQNEKEKKEVEKERKKKEKAAKTAGSKAGKR